MLLPYKDIKHNKEAFAKAKASVRSENASCAGFFLSKYKIAHSQKKKSFATMQAKEVRKYAM